MALTCGETKSSLANGSLAFLVAWIVQGDPGAVTGPITGPLGYDLEFAPPEDGRHCPSCRTDLRQQPPTLRQAVFGRRPRSK
ncbi:hypothetical protein ABT255_56005 [Streptomyces mirabilis]|uniref:hypothetical protein n=1 Tax=Streptomyces mirabilis TaxID=68239 RepID=UPI00332368D4